MSDPDLVRRAWQADPAEPVLPDLETVRAGADLFFRRVRRRNRIEYGACVFVLICFTAYAIFLPSQAARIGAAMIVAGTLLVGWQLNRRASAAAPSQQDAATPILIHQRAQLARQRDALASVFTWYLLPLIPGLLVMTFAGVLDSGMAGLGDVPRSTWLRLIASTVVFTGIWLLNRRAARRLQVGIDEIDALTERDG